MTSNARVEIAFGQEGNALALRVTGLSFDETLAVFRQFSNPDALRASGAHEALSYERWGLEHARVQQEVQELLGILGEKLRSVDLFGQTSDLAAQLAGVLDCASLYAAGGESVSLPAVRTATLGAARA